MKRIVVIGAGNVAFHIVKGLNNSDVEVVQVYNRSRRGLSRITKAFGVPTTTRKNQIKEAGCYILAVNDDSIKEVAQDISQYINGNAIVAHTSGNCSINVFTQYFPNFGALYPLQTFNKYKEVEWKKIPIFISTSNQKSSQVLKNIASQLSEHIISISDQKRAQLHIPAVMVNNFVNHLYAIAFDYCRAHNLKFEYLIPLMEETLSVIELGKHPANSQTGPAFRKDIQTIKRHRSELKSNPQHLKLYNYITKHITDYHENH